MFQLTFDNATYDNLKQAIVVGLQEQISHNEMKGLLSFTGDPGNYSSPSILCQGKWWREYYCYLGVAYRKGTQYEFLIWINFSSPITRQILEWQKTLSLSKPMCLEFKKTNPFWRFDVPNNP